MEFTLTYQGALKANGGIDHKQDIRRAFHPQLQILWQQPPLNHFDNLEREPPSGQGTILQDVGPFAFAPVINKKFRLTAELDILFLRPEAPGSIITQGGDLDNRLKTLFDSLRMPKVLSELPSDDKPQKNETPFLCVLEDDNLITKITVKTDRLLQIPSSDSVVHLVIRVKTVIVEPTIKALAFIS